MPSKNRGLSLLEVLVAFSILAVTVAVILRVFATGLRGAAGAESYSEAIFQAETLLAKTGVEVPLTPGEQQSDTSGRYRWRRIIRPYALPDLPAEIPLPVSAFEVIVEIYWEEGGRRRSVALSSLRLNPKKRTGGPEESDSEGGDDEES
jgi:general secretion pathway protein I